MPDLSMIEIVFWLIVALMIYTLQGYPIVLSLLASMRKEPAYPETKETPKVSFIVAAYNEEKNMAAKIENLRQTAYDSEKIEFIIGSDASTDKTDEIVTAASKNDSRIKYFRLDQRGGKIAVLHKAMEMAGGSIIVFTDCSVRTKADIIPIILSSFADRRVGLVSSRDIWVDDDEGSPVSQHKYIDYEMNIRRLESRLNSLVSASGSFFAVRRELFKGYGHNQADDFALPLQIYRQGFKVIHRDDLIGYVPMVKSSEAEFKRRARIVEAGIRTVLANISLLNPLRYPVFAWQLWSHKMLKWLFPFMVIANLILTFLLLEDGWVYVAVAAGYFLLMLVSMPAISSRTPFFGQAISFFVISTGAVLKAWFNVLTGAGAKTWEPTHR